MRIQGPGHITSLESKARFSPKKNPKVNPGKEKFPQVDTVEIRNTGVIRADLLEEIKKKINSGFYNSDSVLEDLSHGFAKTMGQSL
ncbi:MAG: flagellar biosynthesis anti-sigma factor FlgM [Fibrobacter sp.]|nr:flagellar biosynthesis anti-sigma factor FlgM [Fibrobacter sp.]